MTTTQAHALERLIRALESHSVHGVLDVTRAMARVPGSVGRYLDTIAGLDDAALAELARNGLLLQLAVSS
jgi:hypothetical protein